MLAENSVIVLLKEWIVLSFTLFIFDIMLINNPCEDKQNLMEIFKSFEYRWSTFLFSMILSNVLRKVPVLTSSGMKLWIGFFYSERWKPNLMEPIFVGSDTLRKFLIRKELFSLWKSLLRMHCALIRKNPKGNAWELWFLLIDICMRGVYRTRRWIVDLTLFLIWI